MGRFIDLSGQIFGRLTVLERTASGAGWKTRWLCECKCGKQIVVQSENLKSGHTQSCGCLRKEIAAAQETTHGHSQRGSVTPTYRAWCLMLSRVRNTNLKQSKDYVGRGITVCKEWEAFETFLADMGERPSPQHSIDRKDNSGNYCKENCRWATKIQQARNTRTNHFITINGEARCIAEWAELRGISSCAIVQRINSGWSEEDAVMKPLRVLRPRKPKL